MSSPIPFDPCAECPDSRICAGFHKCCKPPVPAQGQAAKQTGAARLAAWFAKQCNGDWEHSHGIKISTTDNPGWMVEISLTGTNCLAWMGSGKRDGMSWELHEKKLLAYDEETGDLEGLLSLAVDVLEEADMAGNIVV